MTKRDLLPPNATSLDQSVMAANAIPEPLKVNIGDVGRAHDCPIGLLPWLAWALSVDEWNPNWSEQTKRDVIAASVQIHRRKGTFGAVRRALNTLGFRNSKIIEGFNTEQHDGTFVRDGSRSRGTPDHWAEYRVFLERPVSIPQAEALERVLASVAPARCHLRALIFSAVAHTHDGTITRDGTNTRGVI